MALDRVKQADAVGGTLPNGWFIDVVPAAYGSDVPLQFSGIRYAGKTPTDATGITFRLLVKTNRGDLDAAALVDVTNASLTITTSPLVVGYTLDSSVSGFSGGRDYYGELWVEDTTYGTHLVKEFLIRLSTPTRKTFS